MQSGFHSFHKVKHFVKASAKNHPPNPFLRLLRKLEGEKDGFRGSGGRFAFTAAPNPENEQETL
jgi:hypothetical protein